MTFVSHPTGNTFVRALLAAIRRRDVELHFHTTLGFRDQASWFKALPPFLQRPLSRRAYSLSREQCHIHPFREASRLLLQRSMGSHGIEKYCSFLTPRSIYRHLDLTVAKHLRYHAQYVRDFHAYEDGALYSFREAAEMECLRVYHLPIAYWETSRRILREEAERWPEWQPTLGLGADDEGIAEHKAEELDLATDVICPSEFVVRSLPENVRRQKRCRVALFGSPPIEAVPRSPWRDTSGSLRVLFVGSFTQRKGLADLFAAFKSLERSDVELILAGTPILPLEFYRKQYANFRFEPSRSHAELLQLMGECDLLALPSLVEGRALVQQEALSCGLPILITPNTGGEDLIQDASGFLVPIRQPEAIAERIDWLADNQDQLPRMREAARHQAARYSWLDYGEAILAPLDLVAQSQACVNAS